MNLSKPQQALVGLATLWPVAASIITTLLILTSLNVEEGILDKIGPLIALQVFTVVVGLGLVVFYVLHIMKNSSINQDMRVVWIVLLLAAGLVAAPVYFCIYIWGSDKPKYVDTHRRHAS